MQTYRHCLLAAVLGWVLAAGPAFSQEPPDGSRTCDGLNIGPARAVARVIDGETLGLDDGTELRLSGALAPRSIDAGLEPGIWAAEARTRDELARLLLGKSVELRFSRETSDRYGRLLAQAFLIDGDKRSWVQGHLVSLGLARAYSVANDRACAGELIRAERAAREGRTGVWSEAAYQVRRRMVQLNSSATGPPSRLWRARSSASRWCVASYT